MRASPIVACNKDMWSRIWGNWDYLITKEMKLKRNDMFEDLKLCISTERVDLIEETVKVMIDGKAVGSKSRKPRQWCQWIIGTAPQMILWRLNT